MLEYEREDTDMKVLLVNGSPNEKGNTFTALNELAQQLEKNGVETEIFQIGTEITPCRGCNGCKKVGRCSFNPRVNEFIAKAEQADGFVFGTPVYYGSMAGGMKAFMDVAFYANSKIYALKPACSVTVARRSGTTSAFDEMNKFLTISQMIVISSRYWNNVYGLLPGEAQQDEEGLFNMRVLANNMTYVLKCQQAAKDAGIEIPDLGERKITNFIR